MSVATFTHQSELGDWTHTECVPPRLAFAVEKLWHFQGRMSLLRERSFPRVYSEIILQLGPQYREIHDNGVRGDFFPAASFGGATTTPSVIEAPDAECCVIGIQLHAPAAWQLIGVPLQHTHNLTIDLSTVLGPDANRLAEQCYDAEEVTQRFAIIVEYLERRFAQKPPAHSAVDWASRQLRISNGRTAIAAVQEPTALSKARFVKVFREQTGFAPKQYARILRFRHSLRVLQQNLQLSDAALTSGYYDQAHMHHDFREFTGMTPASFIAAQRYPNSMSLPE